MLFVPPKDRTGETSTSNSQTVFAVAGAFDASFNRFSASMSVGDTTLGYIAEPGVAFKVGLLTYSATNEVTLTTAYDSKGTFSSGGTKEVCMGLPAAEAALLKRPNSFTDATEATSPTAGGSATIAGGLGVAKKLFVGGVASFSSPVSGEQLRLQNTAGAADFYTIGRSGATGFLDFAGSQSTFSGYAFKVNASTNALEINNTGNVKVPLTTASSSSTTGALIVGGGAGIAGSLNVGNFINGRDITAARSSNTGYFFLGSDGTTYLGWNGTSIILVKNGSQVASW